MALHTEAPLATAVKEKLVVGAGVGVMTGQTVHHPPIARVDDILTLGMGKFSVQIMALVANIIAIDQHCRAIAAMSVVTIGAEVPIFVFMQHLFALGEGVRMTTATDRALIGR